MGLKSHTSLNPYLERLVDAGHLEIEYGTVRGLRISEADDVPLIDADIVLGDKGPLLGSEQMAGRVPAALAERFRPKPDFFLRIPNGGLSELGVAPGDSVAVQTSEDAREGETVVARVADRLCYGRMRRIAEHDIEIVPMSADPAQRPIRINVGSEEGTIKGAIIGRLIARPLEV